MILIKQHNIRYEIINLKKNFAKFSDLNKQRIELYKKSGKLCDTKCFICEKPFSYTDICDLAIFKGQENKLVCKKCGERISHSLCIVLF